MADARRQMRAAEPSGDLVEFFIGRFDGVDVARLRAECVLPVIFKVASLEGVGELLALGPEFVDADEAIFDRVVRLRRPGTRMICSTHDFEGMPDLEETLARLRSHGADLYKMAARTDSGIDALRMLACIRKNDDLIGVAMGEAGQPTRILAPTVSDLWTYAPLCEEEATAPGQLTVSTLVEVYRYREIGRQTEVLGVMGDPVRYSPGPHFHNGVFRARGLNAVYVPFVVRKGEAAEFLARMGSFNVRGLSVTMPCKQEVVPGQVINTLTWEGGAWAGDNTDGPGACDCVMPLEGKRVAVLGRGGAGQAISAEARRRGAEVRVFNRVWDELKSFEYDTLIHCTPVGMDPEADECPIDGSLLQEGATVLDVVMGETLLVREARARGCRVATGREMYENQAVRQLKRWFGTKVDPSGAGKSFGRLPASAAL
jgi:3-dehydroquinate dehydratase / shikimate dehydrogenase